MHPFQMKFAVYLFFSLWFINALAYPVIFFCSLTCSKHLVLKVQVLFNFSNFFSIQFAVLLFVH